MRGIMSKTSLIEGRPQPSPGGWEAYRAAAIAIIAQQARAAKSLQTQEVRDANRDH